jgi:hypothetical protein
LLLVVLWASAALWGPGVVNTRGGGDSPFLLQRTHQMVVNLRAGVFPVRWMPDAAYGLGYPFFNHYAALPFYLAALFNLIGMDILTAIKLTQTLGFLAAALAMYGWIYHLWRNRAAAWLAAVAYTVAPFHLINVYVRGDSLSEFYAFAFYPLILWALARVMRRDSHPRRRDVTVLALSYAGLALTHNISALIFSPFVMLYLVLLAGTSPRGDRFRNLVAGGSGLALGLALSAWFWLPALLEGRYGQLETVTLGYFNYANHFRGTNLVQPSLLFDYSIAPTTGGPTPFAMGAPQALIALLGLLAILYLISQQPQHATRNTQYASHNTYHVSRITHHAALLITLLLSTLMITPLSRPLWDHVPLLEMVQFPWRFLSVQALFAAAASGAIILLLQDHWAWLVAGGLAVLLTASTLLSLHPERLIIGPSDVTTTRLQEYELFTGNIGTTIRFEYLPREAVPRFFTSDYVIAPDQPPTVMAVTGTLETATQTQRSPTRQTWQVQVGERGATLAFPLLYWPGWRARIEGHGQERPVSAVAGSGYLSVDVPSGTHTLQLWLGRTPLRAGAEILSVLALLGLLLDLVFGIAYSIYHRQQYAIRNTQHAIRNTKHGTRNTQYASRITYHVSRITPHVLLFLAGLLLLIARSSPPPARQDDLTMDFVARPYLHHNPKGVVLTAPEEGSGGVRLSRYTLSTDQLVPGESLTVTLDWEGEKLQTFARSVSLRLASPAEQVDAFLREAGYTYTLAESSAPLTETTVHTLAVPDNAPRGVYLLQPRLEAQDQAPLAGPYLRPVRVTQGAPVPDAAPVLALAGPAIRLHAATLAPGPDAGHGTLSLEWSTTQRLAANYAVSIRVLDPDGNLRASPPDTQPGYGFAPTSLWRPNQRVGDRYILPLPDDLPAGEGYRLVIVFYQVTPQKEVARVELGPFDLPLDGSVTFQPRPRHFELPADLPRPLDVEFGEQIRLVGYDLSYDVSGDAPALDLDLWWVALQQPETDYKVFVHLFDPETEAIATQSDVAPRQGSYPTLGWLRGEVVSDTVRLSLATVPPGEYRLALGLYDPASSTRLPAITADGTPLPDQRLVLPEAIGVPVE